MLLERQSELDWQRVDFARDRGAVFALPGNQPAHLRRLAEAEMIEIAGGILLATFILWTIFGDRSDDVELSMDKSRSRHPAIIWGPRIIVFGAIFALIVLLARIHR